MHVLEHFHLEVIVPIKVFGIDISITNLTLSMFAAAFIFLTLFIVLALKPKVIPGKRQAVIELLLTFVKRNMVYNMIGKKEGKGWVPLIAGIFVFVLANNMIGLIPGAYTPTSNPIVPVTLALIVFFIVQICEPEVSKRSACSRSNLCGLFEHGDGIIKLAEPSEDNAGIIVCSPEVRVEFSD